MNDFLNLIDANSKISAQQHMILYIFAKNNDNRDLKYSNLIIDENLINRFNQLISNEEEKNIFKGVIAEYDQDLIAQFILNFNEKPWEYEKPVIWGDRIRSQYYIDNLTLSHRFEVYVERQMQLRGVELGLYVRINNIMKAKLS